MTDEPIILFLPVPPSANHLYITTRNHKRILGPEGIKYKNIVRAEWNKAGCPRVGTAPCEVFVLIAPKNKRRIDAANCEKILFDSFSPPKPKSKERCPGVGLWADDSQVVKQHWEMAEPTPGGLIRIEIIPRPGFKKQILERY